MKTPLIIGALATLTLFSCKPSAPEASQEESEKKPKKMHPSDWIPEDPLLVTGRKIYLQECSGCHDEGEEGAPRLSRKAEWDARAEKGLAVLLDHAINGFQGSDGKMPARGGTPSLTDEEVTSAVNYMLATPK